MSNPHNSNAWPQAPGYPQQRPPKKPKVPRWALWTAIGFLTLLVIAQFLAAVGRDATSSAPGIGEGSGVSSASEANTEELEYLAFIERSGDPTLARLSDNQLITAGQEVCHRYDTAQPDENTMVLLVVENRMGENSLPGVDEYVDDAGSTIGSLIAAATNTLCTEHNVAATADSKEI